MYCRVTSVVDLCDQARQVMHNVQLPELHDQTIGPQRLLVRYIRMAAAVSAAVGHHSCLSSGVCPPGAHSGRELHLYDRIADYSGETVRVR